MQAYQNSLIKKTDKGTVVFVSLHLLHDPVLKYAYYVDKTITKRHFMLLVCYTGRWVSS